jgi:hypothetical protein
MDTKRERRMTPVLGNTSESMSNSKNYKVTCDLKYTEYRQNCEILFEVSLLCDKEFQEGDNTRIV